MFPKGITMLQGYFVDIFFLYLHYVYIYVVISLYR